MAPKIEMQYIKPTHLNILLLMLNFNVLLKLEKDFIPKQNTIKRKILSINDLKPKKVSKSKKMPKITIVRGPYLSKSTIGCFLCIAVFNELF